MVLYTYGVNAFLYLYEDILAILGLGIPIYRLFVLLGTPEEQLLGMCETLWEPGMKPDELFECISQVC